MKLLIPLAATAPFALVPVLDTSSAPTVPDAGSAFVAELDALPASFLEIDDPVNLSYVDMTLVWDRLGVGSDPDERLDALPRTAHVETFAQPPALFGNSAFDVDTARSEIGFSVVEIEREAALVAPPNRVIVAEASVSATEIADAVATDPLWSSELNDVDSDAGPYWTWGDDPMAHDVTKRTPMRELGQGGAVAVAGDDPATVIRTLTAEDVEAAMRALAGTDPSVVDEGPFAPMVEAVGEAEVVQATGTTAMSAFMPIVPGEEADFDSIAAEIESAVTFLPYRSVTAVETIVGGEYVTEILMVNFDPATAEANAETAATWLADGSDVVTGTPVAELLPDATVTVDGAVVRVALPAGTYSRAVNMLMAGALFPV